jgi:hypothetical protein
VSLSSTPHAEDEDYILGYSNDVVYFAYDGVVHIYELSYRCSACTIPAKCTEH